MSDQRRLKSIGARYDVEVSRHPDPWRTLRSRLSWIFAVGTLVVCLPWLWGDHRAFQSECVSDAHRVFGRNCQECHDRPLVPLQRMITFNNAIHSTSDKKCQKCHRESNSDHLSPQISGGNRLAALEQSFKTKFDDIGCAGCHTEHRGHSELVRVTDANCTNCHIEAHPKISPRRFELDFANFRDHKEFAIWRPDSHLHADPKPSHSATPNIQWEQGQPFEQSPIKFSHHRHLDPQLPVQEGKFTELRCADCHQEDQSGAYFRPIDFEQHCHRCHKLGFPATGDLPHVKPEVIRGILLNGLAKNLNRPEPRPEDSLGGPTKRPIDEVKSPEELVSRVKDQLEKLEERLFESAKEVQERPRAAGLLEAACTKCHFTERTDNSEIKWKVTSPHLPERWMSHNRFRHDRHSSVECSLCHTRNGQKEEKVDRNQFYPVLTADSQKSASIYASVSATEILMPRIDVCRNCHGQQTQTRASVTDHCIDCHNYHHVPASAPVPAGIRELLNNGKLAFPASTSKDLTTEPHR